MTADEFLHKYHEYVAKTAEEALQEIEQMEPVEGHRVEPVYFAGLGWAIMLDVAAQTVRELGIV